MDDVPAGIFYARATVAVARRPSAPRIPVQTYVISSEAETLAALERNRERAAFAVRDMMREFVTSHAEYHEDMVDELVDGPFMEVFSKFAVAHRAAKNARTATTANRSPAPPAYGAYPEVLLADPAFNPIIGAFEELRLQVDAARGQISSPPAFEVNTPPERQEHDLLWFVYDAGVPAAISDALLGQRQWDVAYTLLVAAVQNKAWNVDAYKDIATRMFSSFRRFARFIAGLPGVDVPALGGDKLDVVALAARHHRIRAHATAEAERAVAALAEHDLGKI